MKLVGKQKPAGIVSVPANVRLVVVEAGSCVLHAVPPDGGDETVVIAQAAGEPPVTLALRTLEHIAGIENSGRAVVPAIIVVSSSREPQVVAARGLMARAMLTHMAARRSGELVLVALELEPAARNELLSLVETLLEEYANRGVTIRLQFRIPSPPLASEGGHERAPGAGPRKTRLAFSARSARA